MSPTTFLLLAVLSLVPTERSVPVSDPDPRVARADSLLSALVAQGFSGVVLVALDGAVVLEKGYGLADRARSIPMSERTVVQIGSNTKDFTKIAILRLRQEGRLSLSDPITRYFEDVPADKRSITIDMLLNHTAGFEQHLGADWDPVTREQLIRNALASTLRFEPGSDESYSNVGYSLLAAIIEQLTGVSYDDHVQSTILGPLGLTDTGSDRPGFSPDRLARSYREGVDLGTFLERPRAADGLYWNLRGNGGMLSTVGDMYRFYQALFADRILPADARAGSYDPDSPLVLAGSDRVAFFFYSRFPRERVEVIIATNSTDYPAPRVNRQLAEVLGIAAPGERRVTSVSPGSTPQGAAAAVLPPGPVGDAARRFLRAGAEAADAAAVRAFLERDVVRRPDDQRTLDERVLAFQRMSENLGALEVMQVGQVTDDSIELSARSRGGVVDLRLEIEPAAPHRITVIAIEAR